MGVQVFDLAVELRRQDVSAAELAAEAGVDRVTVARIARGWLVSCRPAMAGRSNTNGMAILSELPVTTRRREARPIRQTEGPTADRPAYVWPPPSLRPDCASGRAINACATLRSVE
jgi:hypothetical protein